MEGEGKKTPIPEGMRIEITAQSLSIVVNADDPMTVRYSVDPTRTPKEMDMLIELDPGRPIRQLAIYSLEQDRMKIAMAAASKPRPTNFESKAGDFGNVLVLKRQPGATASSRRSTP